MESAGKRLYLKINKVDKERSKEMSIEFQKNVVQEVAGLVGPGWEKITVNIEIDDVEGEIVVSPEADVWYDGSADELRLDIVARNSFKKLREVMAQNDKENRAWTICDLEIQNDGQFKFKFSYDEPPRLATLKE